MKLPNTGDRVFVLDGYFGLRAQQVCVLPEVPDEEILAECNRLNPQLVYHTVVRSKEHARELKVDECAAPGNCADCPGRSHKIALCM